MYLTNKTKTLMKKIFTLISMALVAMSVNAQTTERYSAIDEDGVISSEFNNASLDAQGNKVASISTTHVTVKGVSSAPPEDLLAEEGYTESQSFTDADWPKWGTAEWKQTNKNKNIWYYKDGEVTHLFQFRSVTGSGNPVFGFKSKAVLTGDVFSKLTADYEGQYFDPNNPTKVPSRGEYFEFTADVDGMFKIGFYAVNGTNRALYLVDATDLKVLTPDTEYKIEGYVNGCDNTDGSPLWQASIKINIGVEGVDDYVIGDKEFIAPNGDPKNQVTQPKYGWFVFDAKKDHKYMIFGNSWQFGFRGYEFTPGASIHSYTPVDPVTGIAVVKDSKTEDVNAPIYNLAGQQVSKDSKGVLIQNGRKFVNK